MSEYFKRTPLGEEIFFSSVRDPKFKHNSITVNFLIPLEEEKAAGRAVIPFLLCRGSRQHPDFTQLEQTLCRLYGADLDGDVSQYGEYQILSCSISSVDDRFALDGEAITDRCARLLGEIVLDPRIEDGAFPEEEVRLERQNLMDTIEAEVNEKRTYAINQCRREMSRGTRLAVNKYGTVKAAGAITPQSAARDYRELTSAARVEIIFVGCGDPEPVRQVFEGLFAGVRRQPVRHAPQPLAEQAGDPRRKVEHMDVVQSKLVLGMRPGALPDKRAIDAVRLMAYLYGGAPFALLFQNVREKMSLCYYCAARFDPSAGILMVDTGLEQSKRQQAETAILDQLGAIARGDFEAETLEAAKLAYTNSLGSVGDSLGAVENWCMTRILEGANYSPEDEAADIRTITAQEVAQAAGRATLDTVYFLTGKEGTSHE